MPVAIIIIIALLIIWWKYTLSILIVSILIYCLYAIRKNHVRSKVSVILSELSSAYSGKHFISTAGKQFFKDESSENPLIGYFDKFYIFNGSTIRAHAKFLAWINEADAEFKFVERTDATFLICRLDSLLGLTKENIESSINKIVKSSYGGFVDSESIEARLCDILLSNWPEACWAEKSIQQLIEPYEKMSEIYNNSLDNELMSSFSDKAFKAMNQMKEESQKLNEYMINSLTAMKKAYQYLSVPSAVRSFENISLDPLRIYVKSTEMREAFDNGLTIQREIENLQ